MHDVSIKLNLKGFEELINDVSKAGGNVNDACDKSIRKSADIMDKELKGKMQAANVPPDLISRMDEHEIDTNANRFQARVGYRKGAYDPANPSDGYKVVFLNYGTPNRTKHGKVVARGFIQNAKRTAKRKIAAEMKEAFETIIEGLKK